jgi:hypothetical protein
MYEAGREERQRADKRKKQRKSMIGAGLQWVEAYRREEEKA